MASLPAIANNSDIRFLGTLLGDVIRAMAATRLFRRTEYIRSASVERHRGLAEGRTDEAVDPGLEALSLDETLDFVRGFMLFSMLANLAEDRQGVAAELGADLAEARRAVWQAEGIGRTQVATLLDHALIVPVLTAHPTEVRRKSMIDHRNRIAELMRLRDAGRDETPDGDRVEDAILPPDRTAVADARRCAASGCTSPTRSRSRSSYLRDIFLPVLPALYQRWERALGERPPSFLRIGSWIGGDRDGNPNVTADSLRLALGARREAVLVHYLDAVHALGAELSISTELRRRRRPRSQTLAEAAATTPPAAPTNPIAARISGIYARLAATLSRRSPGKRRRRARPRSRRSPMPTPQIFAPISSRSRTRSARTAAGCCDRRRARRG